MRKLRAEYGIKTDKSIAYLTPCIKFTSKTRVRKRDGVTVKHRALSLHFVWFYFSFVEYQEC